jgi:hypothetical protein
MERKWSRSYDPIEYHLPILDNSSIPDRAESLGLLFDKKEQTLVKTLAIYPGCHFKRELQLRLEQRPHYMQPERDAAFQ